MTPEERAAVVVENWQHTYMSAHSVHSSIKEFIADAIRQAVLAEQREAVEESPIPAVKQEQRMADVTPEERAAEIETDLCHGWTEGLDEEDYSYNRALIARAIREAEQAALKSIQLSMAKVLPRYIELRRYREEREGTAYAQDFAEAELLLRRLLGEEKTG